MAINDDLMSKYPGGCPFKAAADPETPLTAINSNDGPLSQADLQKDEEDEAEIFKEFHSKNTEWVSLSASLLPIWSPCRALYGSLRSECQKIEERTKDKEQDILRQEDESYLIRKGEADIARLVAQQTAEVNRKTSSFQATIQARSVRKRAKQTLRNMARETKSRDLKILQQDVVAKIADEVKFSLTEKRAAFEEHVKHIERKHEKQRKQLIASQERKIANERTIADLETKHLKEEIRGAVLKNVQEKINYQKIVDKRSGEHLREVQRMEMRHARERFDFE